MSAFRRVRGMRDFLPEEARIMKYIEGKARRVAQLYGYGEIMTPVLEPYELLAAKAGEEVRSRMYAFMDLGGRKVALRPEFTASVARLVATTLRNEPKPLRMFCAGSLYRYDEPQQGRFREFWQSNYELMGSSKPEADAEIIMLTNGLMNASGLKNCVFKVGHVGVLRGILSQERIGDKVQNGIMQLMDKKEYDAALELVEEAGFARGLEYYTGMVFEVYAPEMDIALGGGGRYDKLIEMFGGEPTRAVGVAHGIDRIMMAMQKQKAKLKAEEAKTVAVIPVKEKLKGEALKISRMLREANITVEVEVMGRKVTKGLEDADRRKMDYAVIVGEKELREGAVAVRNLKKREQKIVKIERIVETIRG